VEERAREIAVLRALGFNGLAVASSVVIEAMLLATLGAFLATTLVWLRLDGFLYNGATSVFRVTVDLHLLLVALVWGLAVALPGTLLPALRLARQTPIDALREVQRCAVDDRPYLLGAREKPLSIAVSSARSLSKPVRHVMFAWVKSSHSALFGSRSALRQ
jgi:hypothetical protein